MSKGNGKKARARKRKPLVISIHGDGLDIEATIASAGEIDPMIDQFVLKLFERANVTVADPASAPAPAPAQHPFDVVREVIEHGDDKVLESILTIAKAELDRRAQVQTS